MLGSGVIEEIRPTGNLAGDRSLVRCAEAKAGPGSEQSSRFPGEIGLVTATARPPWRRMWSQRDLSKSSMMTNPNISWLPETTG